jgi:putative transposase
MWTPHSRAEVGDFGAGQALSDEQYQLIAPLIPGAKPGGRPRSTDMRRLLDGLFYLVRTGCQWRHLPPPPAFPPWPTVYSYRARGRLGDHPPSVSDHAARTRGPGAQPDGGDHRHAEREDHGKGGPRGYDAAKKVKGCKRHIAVDTSGLLLGVIVHAADIQDADSARDFLKRIEPLYYWLETMSLTAYTTGWRSCSPAYCSASR